MKINIRIVFQLLIVAVIIEKLVAVMFSAPDRAIWINRFAVNGISNPEGYLWSLLNPWELGPFKYKVWCFTFDMVMLTAPLLTLKIPVWYLAFQHDYAISFCPGWGQTFQIIAVV